MNDQELCQLLEQLHTEIKQTDSVDPNERELLHDLEVDIRELLERCDADEVQIRPVKIRRLEDAISYMAVNHPKLTAMPSSMSTILSNAGV